MASTLENPNAAVVQLSPEDVREFLYREARFLDDKEWEKWLALYAPNVEFWMPSWDDDDQLVSDPQSEISLIWYGNKGGLEDRVFVEEAGLAIEEFPHMMEYAAHGIRVCGVAPGGTAALPRRIPRNGEEPSAQKSEWYRQVQEQTTSSSLMKRYGTADEQAAAILFLASGEASHITGVTLPVAGGDLG